MPLRPAMLEIVPVTPELLGGLVVVERECFSDPWSLDALQDELRSPLAVYYAALWEGALAGYAGMRHILDEGHINNVAVLLGYRRRGIARALIARLVSYAAGKEMAFLTLEARESNAAAIALYESLGFRLAGRRPGYYSHPREDALLLTLEQPV